MGRGYLLWRWRGTWYVFIFIFIFIFLFYFFPDFPPDVLNVGTGAGEVLITN